MSWFIKPKAGCATVGQSQSCSARKPRKKKWGRKLALAFLIFFILFWAVAKLMNPKTLPVKNVKVIDVRQNVDPEALRLTVLPFLARGMLWLNVRDLEGSLQRLPWVATAQVARRWPATLYIYLNEELPVAHWNGSLLMTAQGRIFDPGKRPGPFNLPLLYGPSQEQLTVWTAYQTMNQMLAPLQLRIARLQLSPRQAWELYLNNGMHLILGQTQVLQRLQRFIRVYPQIFAHAAALPVYIDLRYSNGLAVKWTQSPASASKPLSTTAKINP